MAKQKVIVDCDIGSDDAVALTALLLSDAVEVLGITTVQGNIPVEASAQNALRLCAFLGRPVPVYAGCPLPMVKGLLGPNVAARMERVKKLNDAGEEVRIHNLRLEGLPDAPEGARVQPQHACEFIMRTLADAREKIALVAVGPLTNLGMVLRMAPHLAEKIAAIYIMGGGVNKGNRAPMSEANFIDDPEAAQIVLRSGTHNIITPLEPSVQAPFGPAALTRFEAANPRVGAFIRTVAEGFAQRMRFLGIYSPTQQPGMYDWNATAPLLDPGVVAEMRREEVDVEVCRGFTDGMLVIDRRGFKQLKKSDTDNHIVYQFHEDRLIDLFAAILEKSR